MTKERCNCDASCGENRYHDLGEPGCRYHHFEGASRPMTGMFATLTPVQKKKALESKVDPVIGEEPKEMSRPWGHWYVNEKGKGYKVKRLEIWPDKSISLQYHIHRSEVWTIVQGEGRVIVDDKIFNVKAGDTFTVPKTSMHKITNTHLTQILVAIEVQIGDITDESDIVRL
jgi:mannose-6-phosphate isomerase